MPKTIQDRLTDDVKKVVINKLLSEFKKINSNKNLEDFFKKFMTAGEKDLIFRRIAIIKLISMGKKYSEIKLILRVSDNTISNSVDIMAGRGYGQNPNRKRIYSKLYIKQKPNFKTNRKYKSSESILNIVKEI